MYFKLAIYVMKVYKRKWQKMPVLVPKTFSIHFYHFIRTSLDLNFEERPENAEFKNNEKWLKGPSDLCDSEQLTMG